MLDTGTHRGAGIFSLLSPAVIPTGQFFMKNISGDGDKLSFPLQTPYEDSFKLLGSYD